MGFRQLGLCNENRVEFSELKSIHGPTNNELEADLVGKENERDF